jgi:quinol monooxygenase YgiN
MTIEKFLSTRESPSKKLLLHKTLIKYFTMKQIFLFVSVLMLLISFSCKPKTTAPAAAIEVQGQKIEVQKMITAKVYVKPGREDDFTKAAQWIIDLTRKEAGCLEYTLYQDPVNKTNFFFFERYRDQAAIDAHFAASYFKEFGQKAGEMTSQATDIKIWEIFENK